MMDLKTRLSLAAHDEWDISAESRELARDAHAEIERLRGVDARLTAALIACGDVGKALARANTETERAERAIERLYRVLNPALAAMQRADDAMTYGLAECERLRARITELEAEASVEVAVCVAIGTVGGDAVSSWIATLVRSGQRVAVMIDVDMSDETRPVATYRAPPFLVADGTTREDWGATTGHRREFDAAADAAERARYAWDAGDVVALVRS
jgi:hypothetical protein